MISLIATVATGPVITFPKIQYSGLVPELALLAGALICMLGSALSSRSRVSFPYTAIGVVTALFAGIWSLHLYDVVQSSGARTLVGGSLALDGFSTFFMVLISIASILTILLAEAFIYRVGEPGPDFVSLLLLSSSGAMFMSSAEDLIVLFLGLEILSISLYVLVAYAAKRSLSKEAAFKYFILGGFSSAIFLYGVALVYGSTGSTNIGQIALFLSTNDIVSNGVLLAGIALILVGLGFKVAAAPFQLWTPDVYQGAPTTVTGYMAAVAKAGGFAGLLRVFYVSFSTLAADWRPIVLVLALLSLFAGAILAVTQSDIKRMLAYSSVNHAGFILVGLYVATGRSISDSMYYIFTYAILAIGTFGVVSIISYLEGRSEGSITLADLRGLSKRNPTIAVVFAVLLVAQAGAPFTTGFLAKFSIITAAVSQRHYVIAILAMLSAVIAVYFYLRIVFAIYATPATVADSSQALTEGGLSLNEGDEATSGVLVDVPPQTTRRVPLPAMLAVGLSLVVTVGLGVVANPMFNFALHAIPLH